MTKKNQYSLCFSACARGLVAGASWSGRACEGIRGDLPSHLLHSLFLNGSDNACALFMNLLQYWGGRVSRYDILTVIIGNYLVTVTTTSAANIVTFKCLVYNPV
jgi:hypothetical protein